MSAYESGTTMNIRELIKQELEGSPDAEAEIVAKSAIEAAGDFDALVELVFPVLLDEVRRIRRNGIRALERPPSAGTKVNVAERRRAWLRTLVLATGFPATTWGEAGVEVHRAKAEQLRVMAQGTMQTAKRHEIAAHLLAQHGVHRLNDLPEDVLEKVYAQIAGAK